jgi:hypothetical protein
MFRASLAYPQEVLHKRLLVYCVGVMSVGCYQDWSGTQVLVGRPSRRWEDNIKMELQEVGVWIGSSWLSIGTAGGHLRMR